MSIFICKKSVNNLYKFSAVPVKFDSEEGFLIETSVLKTVLFFIFHFLLLLKDGLVFII